LGFLLNCGIVAMLVINTIIIAIDLVNTMVTVIALSNFVVNGMIIVVVSAMMAVITFVVAIAVIKCVQSSTFSSMRKSIIATVHFAVSFRTLLTRDGCIVNESQFSLLYTLSFVRRGCGFEKVAGVAERVSITLWVRGDSFPKHTNIYIRNPIEMVRSSNCKFVALYN
jgi:hypothetical protein